MSSIFAGIIINFVINYILSVLLTLKLISLFSKKSTNIYIKGICFIMMSLNLFLAFCLVSDIFFSFEYRFENQESSIFSESEVNLFKTLIGLWYKIIFWVNSLFPLLVFPVIIAYEESGEFTFSKKIKNALIKTALNTAFVFGFFGGIVIF